MLLFLEHLTFLIHHLSYNNSHPFSKRDVTGRLWTLEHNGTIFSCDELEKYREIQKGQCDSERILLFLIDLINERTTVKGCMLSDEERAETVDQAMSILSPNNKVNILLYPNKKLL
mgnify:CR=1 FL=1